MDTPGFRRAAHASDPRICKQIRTKDTPYGDYSSSRFWAGKNFDASYDVVMLNIYKTGWPKCVSIEAMVVKSINKIHQPGIFAIAKKFESQGYILADDRLIQVSNCQ